MTDTRYPQHTYRVQGKIALRPAVRSHILLGPCSPPGSCTPCSPSSFRRRPGSRRPTEGQGGQPLVHSLVLGRQVQTRVTDRAKYPLRVRILLSPTAVGRGIPWCSQFPPAGHCASHLHGYIPVDTSYWEAAQPVPSASPKRARARRTDSEGLDSSLIH